LNLGAAKNTRTALPRELTMPSEAERIIGLYQRHAEQWDKDRGRILQERAWINGFLGLMPPGSTVLDLGCGSGEPIGRYLVEQGCEVTGVDSSPPLIAMCKERFPGHEWVVADMRSLTLGRRFDGILAWDSFFHLCPDDQRRMFPNFRMHAAPHAGLLFTSGPMHGEVIGSYQGEPLYHGSLDAAEYRSLLDANGFDVVSHVAEDPTCGDHTIWLAQMR
jgi:SAM-dependent methyltransferase